MRKTLLVLALSAVVCAPSALAGPNEDAVMNADRAFNAMAQQKGVAAAFAAYAAPNALIFQRLPDPVRGPAAIGKFQAEEFQDGAKLTWAPKEAIASQDGTIGTTWGRWTFNVKGDDGKPLAITGTYLTVWQKQADGSWKYTHDMGQSDLPPEPPAPPAAPKP